MTDIEQKALALVNEACKSDFKDLGLTYRNNILDALLLAIERHEAFRQEVSDAVGSYIHDPQSITGPATMQHLRRFIIAKPDPLVEAWDEAMNADTYTEDRLSVFRAAIEKRGGKIVWGEG